MESCILYQNSTSTVYLIDIPRSIEVAQGFHPSSLLKILSTPPLETPFLTPEPKSSKARLKIQGETHQNIRGLLLEKHLELALEELRQSSDRKEWCLKRVSERATLEGNNLNKKPHRSLRDEDPGLELATSGRDFNLEILKHDQGINKYIFYQNGQSVSMSISFSGHRFRIPPLSTTLHGSIHSTIGIFSEKNAPQFGIIIADPPWPNRSARRNGAYRISNTISEIESLLISIPIPSHLANNGVVGIWVTNKSVYYSLILKLFDQWNLSVIEEWIWLKTTILGQPIFPLTSLWRKPYELLLVGRKVDAVTSFSINVKRRVLFGVPDRHSRKPNLKGLMEKSFSFEPGTYTGLEIFARNSTMGWWSWGDEALMFQEEQFWNIANDDEAENEA